ncbi:F-box domain [Trinorchestia longiramus]|nr:F-box domain [Trinorchestia longiramus]
MIPSVKKIWSKNKEPVEPLPYFDYLANEIVIKIFLYLPIQDLISIAQTCQRFTDVANDKSLLRTINLRSCYGFKWSELRKFLRKPSRKQLIQHVHLDNCYWLDWSSETRFLRSCPNLQTLTLLGVPVSFTQLVPIFNACKQITHLAFSYNGFVEDSECRGGILSLNVLEAFCPIKRLEMTLDVDSMLPPYHFWDTFNNLEELTLMFTSRLRCARSYFYEDTLFSFKPRGIDDNRLPKLRKFTTNDMAGKLLVSMYNPTERQQFADVLFNRNLDRAFLTRWTRKRPLQEASDANGNRADGPSCAILYRAVADLTPWPDLQHLGLVLQPDMALTSLRTILSKCSWIISLVLLLTDQLEPERLACILNTTVPELRQLCVLLRDASSWSLQLQHLRLPSLTHLSLPAAALLNDLSSSSGGNGSTTSTAGRAPCPPSSSQRNGFKRSRIGITEPEAPELTPLGRALAASPLLVDLELGLGEEESVAGNGTTRICGGLHCISQLRHLTRLSLHHLPIKSGHFLIQVGEQCQQLESLRLKDLGPSGLCCYSKHLVQALPAMRRLRDLRVEQHCLVPCRDLLQTLTSSRSLERLVLISPTPAYTSYNVKDIVDLMKNVSSLVFALLQAPYITEKDNDLVARTVRRLRRGRPELVVLTSLTDNQRRQRAIIPLSHLSQMVEAVSWARHHNASPKFR